MAHYTIIPERRTLHGKFSPDLEPVLTIASGDTVVFETLVANWAVEPDTLSGEDGRKFEPRDPEQDAGHALCGPIAIESAQPGMTLEVQVGEIRPASWGWTVAGGWPYYINDRLGMTEEKCRLLWTLDAETMQGRDQHGHQVALRPFMGVMGMPPAEPGMHPTSPPRVTGGNMDCRELIAGSTLFLPIAVPGGLFSIGDGHAAQGDGEVSVTAIECPMERVALTFRLRDDFPITTPHARIPEGWLTLGFSENLEEAAFLALEAMLDLMVAQYQIPRPEALALASVVVNLRVTQLVNGVRGVHAILPDGAIR